MIFRAHQPAFPLSLFVQRLIYFEEPNAIHNLDRFLPDGNTEILIDLRERPQHIYDNETLREIQTCRNAWVSGVRTQPITIPSGKGSRMMIIAFKKGKAYPFYRFPMSEIRDTVLEADLIFGRTLYDLREQLLATRSVEQMFDLVERFLLQQAGSAIEKANASTCIDYAVSSMIRQPGLGCLHRLSEEIGYSQKHFIDLFTQRVGVSPKQYLNILRFQKAISVIETNPPIRWSQLARESGYYDQSHMIHDFKYFSGFTPSEYVKKKSSPLNYIPVN